MTKSTKRLGRGLSSLISGDLAHPRAGMPPTQVRDPETRVEPSPKPSSSVIHRLLMLSPDAIRRNPMQPRRVFDADALVTLADSLKERGAIQPIVVRPAEGGYELIAGERRLRAARLAGLNQVPAIVRSVPDDQLLELALIENIQRTDLNPVERARAYKHLEESHHLTHEEIAARTGEDRATISNYIRLLGLDEEVLNVLSAGEITTGHAKAILGAKDGQAQADLVRRIISENWSVRRTEQAVSTPRKGPESSGEADSKRSAVSEMERRLSESLGTRVTIREGRRRHTGKLTIDYYNLDDFERITNRLGIAIEDATTPTPS
ncbi:MAG: ParB/RepB/Spo0J family partition protein [Phycisphaerae bacterium]